VRRRLDAELVRRGLVVDDDAAHEAIAGGRVVVDGAVTDVDASMVAPEQSVRILPPGRDYVSRGGDKLDAALARFDLDPTGSSALDAGASTGGFTDCLLRRGAARVAAIDVGYGDLAWSLRTDPRVLVIERTNIRSVDRAVLPFLPSFVVADLSFVSLASVIPVLVDLAERDATFVVLVKPQFESPREAVERGGVVRDPRAWRAAIDRVAGAFRAAGVAVRGVWPSPLRGRAGNVEFSVWAGGPPRPDPEPEFDVDGALDAARSVPGDGAEVLG
jgi:23S rRNA (cytidine1920-2'-O)/16S rRNA (cytidine1409-2'-O)-methyltransferase